MKKDTWILHKEGNFSIWKNTFHKPSRADEIFWAKILIGDKTLKKGEAEALSEIRVKKYVLKTEYRP